MATKLSYKSVCELLSYDSKSAPVLSVVSVSVRDWSTLLKNGMVDSSMAFQRDFKAGWLKPVFRGRVADSMLRGFSIGVLHAVLNKSGVIELIDGKQRSNFIALSLSGEGSFEGIEVDDTLNKPFIEWDEKNQALFYDYQIPIMLFKGMDDSDRRLQFERLNSGVALSGYEKKRSGIVNVCAIPSVKKSAELILSVLPSVAGRSRGFQSAEEIILQALSLMACNNYDFTGDGVCSALKSASFESLVKVSDSLLFNAEAWVNLVAGAGDNAKMISWALKKSVLNVALTLSIGKNGFDWINWSTFKSYDCIQDSDQMKLKNASASASASSVAVKARLDVCDSIQSGMFTKNEKMLKVAEKSDDKKNKKNKKNPLSAEVDAMIKPFVSAWGADFATPELLQTVYDGVKEKFKSAGVILPYVDDSGKKSVSFIAKGKKRFCDVADLLGLAVELEDAEAVK